jgi:Lrp/AsnC family transcriptional regulator for asnA, asnC and gidA
MVTMYARSLNEMHRVVSEKICKIDWIIGSESFIEMKRRAKPMPYIFGE